MPVKGSAAFWYNLLPNGKGDPRTKHAGCPVLSGSKWGTFDISIPYFIHRLIQYWFIFLKISVEQEISIEETRIPSSLSFELWRRSVIYESLWIFVIIYVYSRLGISRCKKYIASYCARKGRVLLLLFLLRWNFCLIICIKPRRIVLIYEQRNAPLLKKNISAFILKMYISKYFAQSNI